METMELKGDSEGESYHGCKMEMEIVTSDSALINNDSVFGKQ